MTGAVLHFLTNTSMWLQASSDIHQCMVPGVFWCIVPKHTSLSLLRRFHWLWWVWHWCLQLISHVPYHHLMLVSAPPLICFLRLPPSLLRCFHQLWQNWHWCRTISPVIAVSIDCGMSDVGVCASSHLFITTTSVIAKVFPLTLAGLTLVSAPHLARSYHHLFPPDPFRELLTSDIMTDSVVWVVLTALVSQRGWGRRRCHAMHLMLQRTMGFWCCICFSACLLCTPCAMQTATYKATF